MTNKELREYLERFKDEEEVRFVIADPKSRKAYGPEEVFMIFDENISNPCICIGVGQPPNLDEKAQEVVRKDEIAAQPEFVRLRNNEQRKAFPKDYRSWPQCHRRKKPITGIGCRTDQLSSCVNTSSTTHGGQTNTSERIRRQPMRRNIFWNRDTIICMTAERMRRR